MIQMRFKKKVPADILGVGHFEPEKGGREYPLPDHVAAGLIATKDPDWEEVKAKSNQSEENHSGTTGEGPTTKRRK